jgi:hypothetical protein
MIKYLNLYITIYAITLVQIQILLYKFLSAKLLNYSLVQILFYINKFSKYKFFFFFLLLSLSGLPPFLMFFIKFNIMIYIYFKLNFFLNIIIFIILFLNMLYYIQVFINKNVKVKYYNAINKNKNVNYIMLYYITLFSFFSIFSIFFFLDTYYILCIIS